MLPILPPGSQLWLVQTYNVPQGVYQHPQTTLGPRLAIRDRENGVLIIGAVRDHILDLTNSTEPLAFDDAMPLCTQPGHDPCVNDPLTTFYSVRANADTPVRTQGGERTDVTVGGVKYDLFLNSATSYEDSGFNFKCVDYTGITGGVWIDAEIRPQDWSSVLSGVQGGGELPACTLGSAPAIVDLFDVRGVAFGSLYDGPVTYTGKDQTEYLFELAGGNGEFHLGRTALAEPNVGQQFWLASDSFQYFVLRTSQGGEIVRAGVNTITSLDSSLAGAISGQLGVTVALEESCIYEWDVMSSTPILLHDVVFGSSPPVRIKSGSSDKLSIGGKLYDVTATAIGVTVRIAIVPSSP
jgi:hypothetical protein